jgi:hypothetical protein
MDLHRTATQDIVVFLHGFSVRRIKRESGENPELPRSGKQVRKPKMTLVPKGIGKSGE